MPKFDPNRIAAKTLRQCLQTHARFERERHSEFMRSWREAKAANQAKPLGTRLRDKKLWREQLHRLGDIDDLL